MSDAHEMHEADVTPGVTLKNVLEVAAYLQRDGWKVKKSKLYNDVKARHLRKNSYGTFDVKIVDNYARKFLERLDGFRPAEARLEEARVVLLESRAQKSRAEAELASIKLAIEQGKLVPLEEIEARFCAAVAVLRASMLQHFYSEAKAIVHLVAGDPDKAPDLVEHLRESSLSWFNGFSKRQAWDVEFPEPSESPEPQESQETGEHVEADHA